MCGTSACTVATDCTATQTTLCIQNICTADCCGTQNAPNTTTCTDNGGAICDGNGHCVECNTAAQCAPASCTGSTFTPAATCSVSNTCVPGTPAECANNFACSNGACATSCGSDSPSGDAFCASGFYCNGTACVATLGTGADCTRDGDCTNGTCEFDDAGPNTCN